MITTHLKHITTLMIGMIMAIQFSTPNQANALPLPSLQTTLKVAAAAGAVGGTLALNGIDPTIPIAWALYGITTALKSGMIMHVAGMYTLFNTILQSLRSKTWPGLKTLCTTILPALLATAPLTLLTHTIAPSLAYLAQHSATVISLGSILGIMIGKLTNKLSKRSSILLSALLLPLSLIALVEYLVPNTAPTCQNIVINLLPPWLLANTNIPTPQIDLSNILCKWPQPNKFIHGHLSTLGNKVMALYKIITAHQAVQATAQYLEATHEYATRTLHNDLSSQRPLLLCPPCPSFSSTALGWITSWFKK